MKSKTALFNMASLIAVVAVLGLATTQRGAVLLPYAIADLGTLPGSTSSEAFRIDTPGQETGFALTSRTGPMTTLCSGLCSGRTL